MEFTGSMLRMKLDKADRLIQLMHATRQQATSILQRDSESEFQIVTTLYENGWEEVDRSSEPKPVGNPDPEDPLGYLMFAGNGTTTAPPQRVLSIQSRQFINNEGVQCEVNNFTRFCVLNDKQ